ISRLSPCYEWLTRIPPALPSGGGRCWDRLVPSPRRRGVPRGIQPIPAMSDKRDYYEVLSVERTASADEVRKAYKREALKHHPDRNPGDAASEAKFRACNEAYQVLSDDEKRRIYDQFGHAGLEGGGGFEGVGDVFAHMQDLFSEMFSGGGFAGFGGGGGAR